MFVQSNLDKWDTQRLFPTVPHSQVSHIARACAKQNMFSRTGKTVPHSQVSHIAKSHIARFDCICKRIGATVQHTVGYNSYSTLLRYSTMYSWWHANLLKPREGF